MIDPVSLLPSIGSIGSIGSLSGDTQPAEQAGTGFGDMLASSIGAINDQMKGAERTSEMVATGELADPTTALVEVEKADLAFQMAVEVRNRMIESWQEMTRMGF